MSPISFCKLEGCGNSFVIMNEPPGSNFHWPSLSPRICSQAWGVGADGLLLISDKISGGFKIKMINPDGSDMGMCGNGIRCVFRFLFLQQQIPSDTRELSFVVEGRALTCRSDDFGQTVKVDMGEPSFEPTDIPLASPEPLINSNIKIEEQNLKATAVSMGNPHCVIFVSNTDSVDIQKLGTALGKNPLFPSGVNCSFAQIRGEQEIKLRVWERGAGATLACGTGACATVVCATKLGLCAGSATVQLPGGALLVEYNQQTKRVYLTGPTRELFWGEFATSFFELESRELS